MASKIGKLPVTVPAGVTVSVSDNVVTVKGPKGELTQKINDLVKVEVKGTEVVVNPADVTKKEIKAASAAHGLFRVLIANMVKGVSEGYTRVLLKTGVGYHWEVSGNVINMNLGFSSDFVVVIPEGITVTIDKEEKLTITGIDKQKVGEFSAQIRKLRAPEPYKGKGIRYENEVIRRKVGKTGVK